MINSITLLSVSYTHLDVYKRQVAIQFKNRAGEEEQKVRGLLLNKNEYPFLKNLERLADLLHRLSKMEYGKIITDVRQYQDELLDLKENFYDPILEFWNGEQKRIFDNIRIFKNGNQANLCLLYTSRCV